ncbi:MAG: 3-hydroxyacyl-CoA dehydrogenase family protein, partial [Janthinobacterium lividum]
MIENSIQHGVGQNHLAVAEREAGEIPGFDTGTPARPVNRVGILGAGTMGGGIAMSFVNAGIPVTLVDATAEGLARGLDRVRRNYEASAARGRMTSEQVEQRMSLISGGTQDAELAECDLVIEAVFEELYLKQRVCARLGNI